LCRKVDLDVREEEWKDVGQRGEESLKIGSINQCPANKFAP
jgi:hypothetical protein